MTKPPPGRRFSADPAPVVHGTPTRAVPGRRTAPGRSPAASRSGTRATHRLPELPARRVPASQRYGVAAAELAGAALAIAAGWLIWTTVYPSEPLMRMVAWFGVLLAAGLAVVAVLRLRQGYSPAARTAAVDGGVGVGVRAWPGEFWLEVLMDAALTALCLGVLGLDLSRGGRWLPWSLALLLPAAWFGGLSVLALLRRRNPEAVWVVDEWLVHETAWGRARAALSACRGVSDEARTLTLTFSEDSERTLCPRPWRAGVPAPTQLRIDCGQLGYTSADIVDWLAPLLPDGCALRVDGSAHGSDGVAHQSAP